MNQREAVTLVLQLAEQDRSLSIAFGEPPDPDVDEAIRIVSQMVEHGAFTDES